MSLRKFMHARNKYKTPPKFKDLATIYPEFQQHVAIDLTGKLHFNFKNKESLRILAETLLKHDFDLDVRIPVNKLIPALPLRLNYILWIEDLMKYAGVNDIRGVDIGTGAICIYPLLCAKKNGWKMTATDIDPSSVLSAIENVQHNNLDEMINVIPVDETFILKEIVTDANTYSFTMCNPPFFDLDESDRVEKNSPPRNARTGSKTELTVSGGEYSFIHRIIEESMELKNNVLIYTSMIGLKSNLLRCRSELERRNIQNSTWTEFCQGYTKRWGLAWCFLPKNLLDLAAAPVIRTTKCHRNQMSLKNNVSELVVPMTEKLPTADDVLTQLKSWIGELKIDIRELSLNNQELDGWTYELCAHKDTWSHARRRRRIAMRKVQLKQENHSIGTFDRIEEQADFTDTYPVTAHVSNNRQPYLELNLLVEKSNTGVNQTKCIGTSGQIKICMIYRSGYGGKNALETFKHYLINKFNIREYMLRRRKENSTEFPMKKIKM